jgi:hypothetical protein
LGKIWHDLDHVWYLEPKTLTPCPMNFTIDSKNPSFPEIREGKLLLELALPSKMIQRGSESNVNKVLAQEGDCSVNLASQGHCAGVFIGA